MIGNRIKQLRLAASMTQEQLANSLGVSAQAVSKWESGVNMPDILLLPELSVIFGVSIDELFSMTDEKRMDRIDNMIWNTRFLSEEEFRRQERYLSACRERAETADRATLLLAMLYNKRANEYREKAKPLAREALARNPGVKDAHNAVFDAENGAYQDWNCINHRETIDFYKGVVEAHPEDLRNYFWLLDLLIADCRTAEARQYAERMRAVYHSYHYEMFMGHICRAEGDLNGAMEWWNRMLKLYPDKEQVLHELGSIHAKLGRYDEAVEYYRRAMPLRAHPRFTDCEDAISQICMIKGDIAGAIEMQRAMREIVVQDWTTEGESVDSIDREILRLEEML
ncbi:MAG: helix-turn-helix domain-containing protein [Oscillospiraceae bacterium]|nr:helix-turn-helix domain-containing protein [Oscillospiraceae bacterium]